MMKGNMKKAVLKEGNEKNKNEKDMKNLKENEKSLQETIMQEQKIGTSDLEMMIFHFKKI